MTQTCTCDQTTCECEKICNESANKTDFALYIVLPTIFGIIFIIISRSLFNYLKKAKNLRYDKGIRLIVQSGFLISWFGIMSWGVYSYKNPCGTVSEWFNGDEGVTIGTVIVGMFSNIIFGFIDNAGLFFGGCYLDELFSQLPGSDDANVVAGYGNTYSDFLGAFLGTFCGLIISDATSINDGPIWAQALGIIIGCLLGILIPKLLLKGSSTMGLNKVTARQVLLGAMQQSELEAIISGQSLLEYRAMEAFKKIDANGDGHLTKEEVKEYMKIAMGQYYDQEQLENELKLVWDKVNFDGNTNQFSPAEFKEIYIAMSTAQLDELKEEKKEEHSRTTKTSAVQPLKDNLEVQQLDQ